MSTYLYLRCDAHDPPLFSEDEVGQHLYDLPAIRRCIAMRGDIGPDDHDGAAFFPHHYDYFARHAFAFLRQHKTCPVAIEDEYGEEHPVEVEEAPPA